MRERRSGKPPVPKDLRSLLSPQQLKALNELEGFGWQVDYVRRPLFQQPRVVMHDPDSGRQAMITEEGMVDYFPMETFKRADE